MIDAKEVIISAIGAVAIGWIARKLFTTPLREQGLDEEGVDMIMYAIVGALLVFWCREVGIMVK